MSKKPRRAKPKRYGYARVSTTGQSLDAQLEQLTAAGCTEIFQEQISGRGPARKQLMRLLKKLGEGDELVVTRIDRLARSTLDLFAIVRKVEEAGAKFISLSEPWADTGTSTGRLMLAVLAGLADVERDLILTRTQDGLHAAKARGVQLGRPNALTEIQQGEVRARYAAGETVSELARSYNVGRGTINRVSQGLPRTTGRIRRTRAEIEAIGSAPASDKAET
jgi:DNA invertase Pin-like site-specific DNA recombinase